VDINAIHDIRVFDKFSFISVPQMEAEQILVVFGKNKRNGRSLVTRAKEKDGGGGGGRGFSGGGGGGYKKFDDRKPKFEGERKRYEDRAGEKSFGEKKSFGDRKEFGDRKPRERKPFDGEKKAYAPKTEFKKEFVKTEEGSEHKPARKRENKLTDYLDKTTNPKPEKKKKEDNSEIAKFMKKFDDDLSW
jgi:ATP-dependent RNA helicase DeaD